jgi:hypothetical protein
MSTWDTQFVGTVRQLLLLEQPPLYDIPTEVFISHFGKDALHDLIVSIQPIPNILCNVLDWIVVAERSELFKKYWRDSCGIGKIESIVQISREWSSFCVNLLNGTLELGVLDKFGDILLIPQEAGLFVCTALGVRLESLDKGDLKNSFVVLAESDPQTSKTITEVSTINEHAHVLYL